MEPLLPSVAKLELMNGACCRNHHSRFSFHKHSSVAVASDHIQSNSSLIRCLDCSSAFTPRRSGNVVALRRLENALSLRPQSRKRAVICLFERNNRIHASSWCSGGQFDMFTTVIALSNQGDSCAKFAPKVWRKDSDAQVNALSEQSSSANEELLLFFFQLDLTTRLQRALNLDQYQVAQQLREKIMEVDKEVERLRNVKFGSVSSKAEAQDKAIAILRLKNNLQQTVEAENYDGAAALRDKISKLEAESLAATATALAFQNVVYSFRLGQKVRHAKFGYRGIICGMDPFCSESDSWPASDFIQCLPRGRNQPFYQVLVDMRAEPNLLVAYVAEDSLIPPSESDKDSFDHPYVSFLFFGMDSVGDYIPIKQLREKYNQPRHELPWEENNKRTDNSDDNVKP